MTLESKPQGSFLPIGTRIRFTKTLASLASGDHPAFLFAEEGDEGEITGHGTKEGYWAKTSYNPPFGVSRDEFEPIEASKPQGSEQPKSDRLYNTASYRANKAAFIKRLRQAGWTAVEARCEWENIQQDEEGSL